MIVGYGEAFAEGRGLIATMREILLYFVYDFSDWRTYTSITRVILLGLPWNTCVRKVDDYESRLTTLTRTRVTTLKKCRDEHLPPPGG